MAPVAAPTQILLQLLQQLEGGSQAAWNSIQMALMGMLQQLGLAIVPTSQSTMLASTSTTKPMKSSSAPPQIENPKTTILAAKVKEKVLEPQEEEETNSPKDGELEQSKEGTEDQTQLEETTQTKPELDTEEGQIEKKKDDDDDQDYSLFEPTKGFSFNTTFDFATFLVADHENAFSPPHVL